MDSILYGLRVMEKQFNKKSLNSKAEPMGNYLINPDNYFNSFRITSAAKSTSFSVLKTWQENRMPLNHCLWVGRIHNLYLSKSILTKETLSIESGTRHASIGEASGPAGALTM